MFGKALKRAAKSVGKFVTGRGKVGAYNVWAYPERYGLRKLRHRAKLTRGSLIPRATASAVSFGSSAPSYLGSTGFRRMV